MPHATVLQRTSADVGVGSEDRHLWTLGDRYSAASRIVAASKRSMAARADFRRNVSSFSTVRRTWQSCGGRTATRRWFRVGRQPGVEDEGSMRRALPEGLYAKGGIPHPVVSDCGTLYG